MLCELYIDTIDRGKIVKSVGADMVEAVPYSKSIELLWIEDLCEGSEERNCVSVARKKIGIGKKFT